MTYANAGRTVKTAGVTRKKLTLKFFVSSAGGRSLERTRMILLSATDARIALMTENKKGKRPRTVGGTKTLGLFEGEFVLRRPWHMAGMEPRASEMFGTIKLTSNY